VKVDTYDSTNFSVGSFFVGCGGLDLGFRNVNFDLVWANEIQPTFADSYSRLLETDCIVGDFWHVAEQVPDVDVIIGGPPCQSFSLVGKRLQDDPRGKLVSGFYDLIERKRPRAFLMENVSGLSASKIDGKALPFLLAEKFTNLGYEVLVSKVDASDYLVPQRRKRIIILGVQKPTNPLRIISPREFREHIEARSGIKFEDGQVSSSSALSDLPQPSLDKNESLPYLKDPSSSFQKLIRMGSSPMISLQFMPTMSDKDKEFVKHIPPGGNYMDIPDSVSTTRIMKFKQTGGRTTTYGRLHPDEPAYTINTYFNRPNVGANYHYAEERLITAREALRLQSFPDFFHPVYKSQRELHIQIGNAVPPLLAEALALSLFRSLRKITSL
jgi:DNA (cytosine-5)-methyltransferase 1